MNHHQELIIFLYFSSLLLPVISSDNNNLLPRLPSIENLAVSCGGSGETTAKNGRLWVGDASNESKFFKLTGKSTISRSHDHPPLMDDSAVYSTARISFSEFVYKFDDIKPGQYYIRLHFHPTPYKNFKRSTDLFTVKAGNYILLSNFSASLTAKALGVEYFSKEFCINVEGKNRRLNVKFSPVDEHYAFVNGIEIVSMPTGLYFTKDGEFGPVVVGQKYRFYIDNGTALETVQRLNIGGSSIDSDEDHQTMFRKWDEDFEFLSETKGVPLKKIIPITYPNSPTHIAPSKVYQTARTMAPENDSNRYNLTWAIPVDSGFRYLVRLHLCELEFKITQVGERMFTILINDQVAEADADVLQWGGKHGAAVYKDYITLVDNHYLHITLLRNESLNEKRADGILNGVEVFKLSNPDNSLVSPNRVSVIRMDTVRRRAYFDRKNAVVTAITFMIILVNIVVYNVRYIIEPKTGERKMKSSASGSLSRSFSIDEIRSFTDNFNPKFLIGSGGYGRVYKGSIDNGETIVAIKRLKLESSQGDNEFWMEIKMLSKLRHEHLVPLIGYCNEGPERVLVYEYMPRGTVADHLYKLGRRTDAAYNPPLSWEQRLKISVGAARGLYVLHTSRQTVVHRDVKSSNILLDENWVAKISDFGLSKMGPTNESITHFSTNVKGTFGYLDPEYFLTKKLTRKSDVYAFGVVLFEILSGRPAVDIRLEEEQHSLAAWARYCLKRKQINQLIEKDLITEISPPCLKVFVGIAGRCIHNHPHERPSMSDVMMSLEYALMLQQNPISEEQEEEYVMKTGRSSSDHSDGGVVSFDDLAPPPPRPSNEETEPSSSTTAPRITKSSNNNGTSSRWWWWNRFGSVPKSPSKARTSPLQDGMLHEFSVQEMSKATNNFHNGLIIGFSGSDTVYKGHISTSPKVVTIRRSNTTESRLRIDRELKSKMETSPSPTSLKHPHIVSLLGYCKYESDMILVYDYQANGVLHDHLYDSNKEPLTWKQRVRIGINAAQGLSHLQSTVKQTVLHRNLNSSNIFLDENMIAKVSDFPLTKRIGITTSVPTNRGNWGFMDSDYIRDDKQMEKSYVFSYGLVLFELLLKPEELKRWLDSDQVAFAQWIKSRIRYEQLTDLIDPNLQDEMLSTEGFRLFVDTASKCLLDKGIERPLMADIVTSLEAVLKLEENADRKRGF